MPSRGNLGFVVFYLFDGFMIICTVFFGGQNQNCCKQDTPAYDFILKIKV